MKARQQARYTRTLLIGLLACCLFAVAAAGSDGPSGAAETDLVVLLDPQRVVYRLGEPNLFVDVVVVPRMRALGHPHFEQSTVVINEVHWPIADLLIDDSQRLPEPLVFNQPCRVTLDLAPCLLEPGRYEVGLVNEVMDVRSNDLRPYSATPVVLYALPTGSGQDHGDAADETGAEEAE